VQDEREKKMRGKDVKENEKRRASVHL